MNKYAFCKEINCCCLLTGLLLDKHDKCIASKCHHPEKEIYDNPNSANSSKLAQELAQRLIKENKEKLIEYCNKPPSIINKRKIIKLAQEINSTDGKFYNNILESSIDILAHFQALKIFGLIDDIPYRTMSFWARLKFLFEKGEQY